MYLIGASPPVEALWREAVPELRPGPPQERPRLLLLLGDDPEQVKEYRSRFPHCPIVAVTDTAGGEDRFYSSGANSVIGEPIGPEARQAVVEFWATHNLSQRGQETGDRRRE